VTEQTRHCDYCGAAFELPSEYLLGANKGISYSHSKDPITWRYTGQIITRMANMPVHECWREVPPDEGHARRRVNG
jgi:hypothetical protein